MSDTTMNRVGLKPLLPILRWTLAVAVGITLTATPARAQERTYGVPRESDVVEQYTVQPGDTLAGITRRFLGTDLLWPENHRLNPHVRDPDLLRIGDRLLIITHREADERSAELVGLSPRVDKRLVAQGEWEEARLADRLGSGDGVQTLRRASAELAFDDGTLLVVSEDSVVFLRRIGRRLTGVNEETIEVERGGADLVATPRRADSSEIEVIVGNTTARPRAGRNGRLNSRVQRAGGPSGDAAELAVYEGSSAVAAAGETVEVGTGMGTVVPADGPPGTPERLLPAPRPVAPRSGEQFSFNNPTFAWSAVEGAVAYELEICRDPQCGTLIDKIGGLTTPSSRPEVLPTGDLYWRVRALSASGLDGYPSRAARFCHRRRCRSHATSGGSGRRSTRVVRPTGWYISLRAEGSVRRQWTTGQVSPKSATDGTRARGEVGAAASSRRLPDARRIFSS